MFLPKDLCFFCCLKLFRRQYLQNDLIKLTLSIMFIKGGKPYYEMHSMKNAMFKKEMSNILKVRDNSLCRNSIQDISVLLDICSVLSQDVFQKCNVFSINCILRLQCTLCAFQTQHRHSRLFIVVRLILGGWLECCRTSLAERCGQIERREHWRTKEVGGLVKAVNEINLK